jgi:hypothetical protein
MFILRRTKGETDGECWPISAASLFIGRSAQCDITVNDPTVSRRHCEVYTQNGEAFLRDLGSSNLTILDGQPVKTAPLHPGNRVIVGTAHFVVEEAPGDAPIPAPAHESARRSMAVDRNMFVDEARLPEVMALGERGVSGLSRLYRLARMLSETQTIQELAMVLHEALTGAFQPEVCWIARYVEERSTLTFFNAWGEIVDAPEDAPRKIVEAAFFRRSGLLWPREKDGVVQAQAAAPMVTPERRVGIVVLQSAPGILYDAMDLELLSAMAHTAAPFVKTMEQAEQTQISLTKLRKQWGL